MMKQFKKKGLDDLNLYIKVRVQVDFWQDKCSRCKTEYDKTLVKALKSDIELKLLIQVENTVKRLIDMKKRGIERD